MSFSVLVTVLVYYPNNGLVSGTRGEVSRNQEEVTVLDKKTFSYRRVPLFVKFMTVKLNYKKERKKAPLIAISHKNRSLSAPRDAIPSVFPGASETNKKS
ncbi:hypothetical protein AVEN_271463-1 [Araneus ventricosus]|uniref:Uncharacterized protein n=1 Tax=Araneus ventricosus TaxID=182803 RepID=A0A4Y2X9J4_ARAVE|nr:hypothetical protein AVEN_271463-1 [Araneus ventricosus]